MSSFGTISLITYIAKACGGTIDNATLKSSIGDTDKEEQSILLRDEKSENQLWKLKIFCPPPTQRDGWLYTKGIMSLYCPSAARVTYVDPLTTTEKSVVIVEAAASAAAVSGSIKGLSIVRFES